jgi:GntR family transcriptional regulator
MDLIARGSKLPFYHQLYEILHGKIVRGEWKPGDTLPPESELIEQYQVSRVTVRQALDILVNEGLIYRQQGRGTFVAHPAVEHGLVRLINFTQDMCNRGFEPGTKVLFSALVPAPPDIAEKLQIEPGEELACLERLRLADGEPMSIEKSNLIHRYCPGVLQHDFTSDSLREFLDHTYGIRWAYAKQVIRAVLASSDLAHLLSVRPKSPLLYVERVSFTEQNIPLEFLRIYYRADRYSLYSELQG